MPKTIEERLNTYPELKMQMLTLLELAESDIERADEVEKAHGRGDFYHLGDYLASASKSCACDPDAW